MIVYHILIYLPRPPPDQQNVLIKFNILKRLIRLAASLANCIPSTSTSFWLRYYFPRPELAL